MPDADPGIGRLPAAGVVVLLLTVPVLPAYVQPTFVAGVDGGIATASLDTFPEEVRQNLTAAADGNGTVAVPDEAYPDSFPARIGGNPLFDEPRGRGLVVGADRVLVVSVEGLGGGAIVVSVTDRTDDARIDLAELSPRGRAVYDRATGTAGPAAFYAARPPAFRSGVRSGGTATFVIDRADGYDTLVIEQGSLSAPGIGVTLAATLGGLAVAPTVARALRRRRGTAAAVGGAILSAAGPVMVGRTVLIGVPPSVPVLVGRLEAEIPTAAVATLAALVVLRRTVSGDPDGDGD